MKDDLYAGAGCGAVLCGIALIILAIGVASWLTGTPILDIIDKLHR